MTERETELLDRVVTALELIDPMYASEKDLQQQVGLELQESRFDFRREFVLSDRDRLDFAVFPPLVDLAVAMTPDDPVEGLVAVEVKIRGGEADLRTQVTRYALDPRVSAVVVVTTSRRLAAALPANVLDKPIRCVRLGLL